MYRRATVPARINIIGEHTDYEGGLSLPFTINSHLTLEVKKSENDFINLEICIFSILIIML